METNPNYTSYLNAIDLNMEKDEKVGDFFNRLKNQYAEAEMEKATPWSLFVCKLISCIPTSGNDFILLKNKLLETFRDNQDPQENKLSKFQTVIKQHKSLVTAREFKWEVGTRVGRVTEEPPKEPRKPHYLCNKVHEKATVTNIGSRTFP